MLPRIYKLLGVTSDRSMNITKHVLISFLYKGGSILSNFLIVPLTLNILDSENYGVWLTLSSFIAWFSFFDIGLGNGLRNKFAEAKAKGNMTLARGYVSSAYYTIGVVSLLLILVFLSLNFFIDWSKVFNTSPKLQNDLGILMPIVFGFFSIQLVVKLITTIYTADLQHSVQGKITFITNVTSLFLIWVFSYFNYSSLLFYGILFSLIPVLILLLFNFFAFYGRYRAYKPSITYWKREYFKDIFGLGISFFVIQMSGIILYSTDNFLISTLFSPADVVPFNIAYKYMSIALMLFSIVAAPYWSSITDAYNRHDLQWIKRVMKNFQQISLLFMLLILIMVITSNYIYNIWVGADLKIPIHLTVLMSIFFAASIYVTPFTMFLNGTGKVKLQAMQSIISALINIPLSIYLAKEIALGSTGVILATIICFLPSIILSRIQFNTLITQSAEGIWNK